MKYGNALLALKLGTAMGSTLMLVHAVPALAADEPQPAASAAAEADAATTEEIVVSARRRAERLIDAPVAITAVTGDTLSQYQATRVSDIATLVPSLIAGKAASGSSASVFLRGVGSTALSAGFDQSVSFVIDNIAMSRGREISLPQFDIKGVEVLKGPQALFFGKNTTGGLISVTSNGPTDEFHAGIKGGYGFKARERYVEAFVSGPVSDTVRARLAGRYSKSDGAFVNTAAASYTNYIPGQFRTRNSDRRGFAESYGLRGTVDAQVSDGFKIELKAGLSSVVDGGPTDTLERICGGGRTTPLPSTLAPGAVFPTSPNTDCRIDGRADSSAIPVQVATTGYRFARDGKLYADFKSQFVALTGTIESDPFDVTSVSGYYHFRQTDLNNVSGESYPAGFSQYADFEQFSEELRFQSKFDGPFNILFGAFYAHGKFVFNTDAYIAPLPLDPINNTYTTFKRDNGFTTDSLSFFAEGTLNLSQQLELSGGARYSKESRKSYQRSLPAHIGFAAAFPGGIALNDKYDEGNLSPQVTLRYKPSTDLTLYAAYKQGFKAGGFNISQVLTPVSNVAAGRYKSETAEGAEIGLRALLLDRRLSFNLTAYHYDYSDLQVQFFDPTTVSLTAGNAGKLRTQGVEADLNLRVPGIDGLSLRGAAAYNDAKYRDFIGQCYPGQTIANGCNLLPAGGVFNGQNYSGRTPPKAPHFAGRAGFTYEAPIGETMSLRMNGDVSYTSKYNFTDALRPDAFQKGFAKVDASVSLSGKDDLWTVSVIGRNLTNRLVVTAANDIPFVGGTGTGTTSGTLADMSAFVDNPREIFVEVGFKF
ncbi:TonB-dependent receptor [Novosphingobium taihuense]|uniref:Outer membrane receptor protein involved in Fe transport n=1 Tax=Novosphingobium taihuense TaxID=260085 RepID=A0A7W7AA21_9SPHN|nr:TonB-dependent receptor [Novosphingobium taihuense]MBB4613027.1 outer membrane receptor protein involved in Fe transport [Novosphingobium taihuense]TWH85171.1 outer membrane receptor protein involved in Fe transport [Novosphingobium taihuense]